MTRALVTSNVSLLMGWCCVMIRLDRDLLLFHRVCKSERKNECKIERSKRSALECHACNGALRRWVIVGRCIFSSFLSLISILFPVTPHDGNVLYPAPRRPYYLWTRIVSFPCTLDRHHWISFSPPRRIPSPWRSSSRSGADRSPSCRPQTPSAPRRSISYAMACPNRRTSGTPWPCAECRGRGSKPQGGLRTTAGNSRRPPIPGLLSSGAIYILYISDGPRWLGCEGGSWRETEEHNVGGDGSTIKVTCDMKFITLLY